MNPRLLALSFTFSEEFGSIVLAYIFKPSFNEGLYFIICRSNFAYVVIFIFEIHKLSVDCVF